MHPLVKRVVLLVAVLLGTATLLAQPFNAQIQQAFQVLGLWPYGVYSAGDVPVWDVTANKFVPGAGGGGSIGTLNVQDYGVTGDGRQVVDAVTTALSTTVTSATAAFVSARDVGKLVWGVKQTGGGDGALVSLPLGTIVSVTNATTIVTSLAATLSNTQVALVWGTNDTAALQAVFAVAFNTGARGPKPTLYLPSGMYLVDELLADWRDTLQFGVPTIIGAGSKTTTFVYKPDFDLTSVIVGRGMLVATDADAVMHYQGFAVTGNSFRFSASLDWAIALNGPGSSIRDVEVHHIGSSGNADAGVILNSCGSFEITTRCVVEDYTAYAVSGAGIFTNSSIGILRNVLIYEFENNVIGNNSNMIVEGGNFADHRVADNICLVVSGGSMAIFNGTRFRHDVSVTDANTVVFCEGCLVDDPFRIGAGATVKVSASKFSGVTDGTWYINAGSAYDLGGNSYLNAGASPVQTKAPYGFSLATTFTLVPTCNAANVTQRNAVSDSNTVVWGATVAGGGADHVGAYCNGTNWTVAAK